MNLLSLQLEIGVIESGNILLEGENVLSPCEKNTVLYLCKWSFDLCTISSWWRRASVQCQFHRTVWSWSHICVRTHHYVSRHSKRGHECEWCVKKCTQVYQSEDNFSINTFKMRTNVYSKHMQNKVRIWLILLYTPIGRVHILAIFHKARTQILSSLCKNVLTLTVLNSFSSSL